jgi:tetratricopeptide (TPR) repeat protein
VDKPYLDIKISVEERYKKSLDLYQEIVSKYPRTKKATIALYGAGNCYFQLKNYDEAEKSYKLFIERYPENKFILPLVYQKLGYLYKVRGKTEDALKFFEKIISFEAGLKDLAYTEMGRIYEVQEKQEEAIKNYQKVVEGFPSSPWFSEAKRRLENLKR